MKESVFITILTWIQEEVLDPKIQEFVLKVHSWQKKSINKGQRFGLWAHIFIDFDFGL